MNKIKLLTCLVLVFIIASCTKSQKPYRAPYFECKGIDGKVYTLETFKGKKLLLVFWATWCPTCKKELAKIIVNLNQLKKENIEILAVCLNRNMETVKKSALEHGLVGIPVVIASKQMTMDYQGVRFLPTAFLINEKGYIVGKLVGELDPKKIVSMFKKEG